MVCSTPGNEGAEDSFSARDVNGCAVAAVLNEAPAVAGSLFPALVCRSTT